MLGSEVECYFLRPSTFINKIGNVVWICKDVQVRLIGN